VHEVEPFEKMKLRLLNASHSAFAYLGFLAGFEFIYQVAARPEFVAWMRRFMADEVTPSLVKPSGINLASYREALVRRFANPALPHRTQQIAMDGSQKLPQRLLGTVRDRTEAGRSYDRVALAIAGWIHYLSGADETGATHEIVDPLSAALTERLGPLARSVHDGVAHIVAFEPVFGDLGRDVRFITAVARHLVSLRQRGVLATLTAQP